MTQGVYSGVRVLVGRRNPNSSRCINNTTVALPFSLRQINSFPEIHRAATQRDERIREDGAQRAVSLVVPLSTDIDLPLGRYYTRDVVSRELLQGRVRPKSQKMVYYRRMIVMDTPHVPRIAFVSVTQYTIDMSPKPPAAVSNTTSASLTQYSSRQIILNTPGLVHNPGVCGFLLPLTSTGWAKLNGASLHFFLVAHKRTH